MIYPEFIKDNDTIGICAPSAGVGKKPEDWQQSLSVLHQHYNTKETPSVRLYSSRGGDAETRGRELTSLFTDPDVDMVMAAAGGDFLIECLPYIDWQAIKDHPKWMMGASDPTSILYTITTKYDIATFYGMNAGSYDEVPLPYFAEENLSILRGNLLPQKTSEMHAPIAFFLPEYNGRDTLTMWHSNQFKINASGRCIGGCFDVLKDLIGTGFDGTNDFINRYQEDGIIWYFDNFCLSAEAFYRTLLQMKYAGWFRTTKAILIGRVLLKSTETGMDYNQAISLALPEFPVIYDMDIGHTSPCFTMINGAMCHVEYQNGKGTVSFTLE